MVLGLIGATFVALVILLCATFVGAPNAVNLNYWLTFRLVVWPQAFRSTLPVLGNALYRHSQRLVALLGAGLQRQHPVG